MIINVHRLLKQLEIDRAVLFILLSRVWQLLTGPILLLLIVRYFSSEVQGFYYTFASLLALQSFFELGFYLVIINVASHEWARLDLDSSGNIVGDSLALSRLVSLGRLIFKWYAVASTAFIVGVGITGYAFFSQMLHINVQWQSPWLALVALAGLQLWLLPFNSLLEGCNQVAVVNQFRLIQAVLSNLAAWLTILSGGGLWVTVISAGVGLLCNLCLLVLRYRRFLQPFFHPPVGNRIHWRTEIWPMQWRLALQGVVSYFMYSLFTPVIFQYHGAAMAGRMGMTWQIVNVIQAIALAWVYPKVPQFGILIANKNYAALDRFWLRVSLVSLAVASGGSTIVWFLVYGINLLQLSVADRLLGPLPTGLLLAAMILTQIVQCQAAYLRAHKQEPLAALGVFSSLMIGFLVWRLGSQFGATGVAIAYLLVTSVFTVPGITFIWFRCRVKWHKL